MFGWSKARCQLSLNRKVMFAVFSVSLCAIVVSWAPPLRESAMRGPLLLTCAIGIAGLLCFRLLLLLRRAYDPPRSKAAFGRRASIIVGIGVLVCGAFTVTLDFCGRKLPLFREAERQLESSRAANEELGEGISIGWPVSLDWEASGGAQKAQLTMPVYGSRGKGTMHVLGRGWTGVWTIDRIFLIPSGSTIQRNLGSVASEENNTP
jgi:hypothetical protein